MSRTPDRLTPHSLALGHLIHTCVTDSELSYAERTSLFCCLIDLLWGGATCIVEPSFSDLCGLILSPPAAHPADATAATPRASAIRQPDVESTLKVQGGQFSRAFLDRFTASLREVRESDDVWELLAKLRSLLRPSREMKPTEDGEAPWQLDCASVLGMYVRRLILAFDRCVRVRSVREDTRSPNTRPPKTRPPPPPHNAPAQN